MRPQALDVLPRADQEQRVPDQQWLVEHATLERLLTATEPDHPEPIAIAERGFDHSLARQRGVGRHHDLDHADLLRPVAEVRPGERQHLELEPLPERLGVGVPREHVYEQDVAGLQLGPRRGADHVPREPAVRSIATRFTLIPCRSISARVFPTSGDRGSRARDARGPRDCTARSSRAARTAPRPGAPSRSPAATGGQRACRRSPGPGSARRTA